MDDKTTMGETVLEYSSNERHLECVVIALRNMGSLLNGLGQDLLSRDTRVKMTEGGVKVGVHPQAKEVPSDAITQVQDLLTDLQTTLARKSQLEDSLRNLGMENLIKPRRSNL